MLRGGEGGGTGMGKPKNAVYEAFVQKCARINKKLGKEQYLVPYLMSSHPGSTLKDAIKLAEYVRDIGYTPEQVQDFYSTPSTISTCMKRRSVTGRIWKKIWIRRTQCFWSSAWALIPRSSSAFLLRR